MSFESDNPRTSISDRIAEEAGFWDARLRAPDCSEADREQFARWRDGRIEHRLAFEWLQTLVANLLNETGRADVRALRDAALRAPKRGLWVRLTKGEEAHPRGMTWRIAAAVCTLAVGATLWLAAPEAIRRDPLGELAAVAARISTDVAPTTTYRTGIGQRSTFTLQDGSSVDLNAQTAISVSFSEHYRKIKLIEGQAYFHVAKHSLRPFIVTAGNQNIVAVGTAFDVRLDADTVRVTLLEGKVKVVKESALFERTPDTTAPKNAAGRGTSTARQAPRPARVDASKSERGREGSAGSEGDEIYLIPGQQFVAQLESHQRRGSADTESESFVRTMDAVKAISWRDGRVFLDHLTLADAVTEMNKYSPVRIRIADSALAQLRVNGMFRAGEQQAFVTALQEYFPIAVQSRGDAEIVLESVP